MNVQTLSDELYEQRTTSKGLQVWMDIFKNLPDVKDFYATKSQLFLLEQQMLAGSLVSVV